MATATNTGTGGVVAVPLVTKGMAETEGGPVDMNYFLGIRQSDGVLAADFEDTATGLNHPVLDTERGYFLAPMQRGIRLTTGAEFADRDAPLAFSAEISRMATNGNSSVTAR